MSTHDSELIQQLLQCPVCNGPFHRPIILPCFHLSCQRCTPTSAKTLTCYVCNKTFKNTPQQPPTAHFIDHLVKKGAKSLVRKIYRLCQGCAEGAASHHCSDCAIFLCQRCNKSHSKSLDTKNHQLCSVEDYRRESRSLIVCPSHSDEEVVFMCKQCEIPVCTECVESTSLHGDHEYTELCTGMDAFVDTNKKIIQEAKTKVTELNINLEVMKNLKLELETNKDSTAQEIMNQLDTYLKAMWEAGQQLVEASNLNFDRSISSLSSAINYGTEIREKLDEMSSLSDDLYQSGDSSSRFFLARQCIGRLKNLLKTSDVRIPADDMISAKFVANDESLRNVSGELIGSVNTVEIRFPENFDSLVVEVPIETTTAHEIAVSPVTDLGSAETRTECAQKTVKSVAPLTEIQIEHENDIAVTSGEHISPASSLSIKTKEHVSSVAAMAGDCEITTDTGGAIQPDARQEPEPIENPESVVSEKVKREVKRQVGVQVEGIRRVEHVQTGRLGSNGTKKLSTHAKLTKTTRETHEQAEDFNFYVPSARDRNSMVQQSVREEMDLGASSGVEFQEPHGIAIATNGYVAIADTGRCEVKLFNRKNNLVRSFKIKRNIFSSSKCCPFDVSFIGVDKLVVTDSENDAVYICNLHGKISKQINDEKLKKPRGVVVDAQGRILVVDGGNRLLRAYNSITGEEIPEFGLNARADTDGAYLQEPWFISVDGANNVYVTDSSTSGIQIYDQNGHFIRRAYVKRSVYSEENISPRGIFVDKQGNICITRYDSGRVYVFNSDRRYLFEFGESWQNYYSLVVNTEGSWSAYITDKAGSSVYVFQNADEKS